MERASDPLDFDLGADGLPPPTLDPYATPETRRRLHPLVFALWLSAGLIVAGGGYFYLQDHAPVAEVVLSPLAVANDGRTSVQPVAAQEEQVDGGQQAEQGVAMGTPLTPDGRAAEEPEEVAEVGMAVAVSQTDERPEPPRTPARPIRRRTPTRARSAPMEVAPPRAPMVAPVAMAMNDSSLPQQPTRQQVQRGLLAVRGAVRACMERGGRVPVRVTILGRTGRVTSARVEDAVFSRQPTGGCIARAVRRAQFPRFQRNRLVVVYPYEF